MSSYGALSRTYQHLPFSVEHTGAESLPRNRGAQAETAWPLQRQGPAPHAAVTPCF